MDIDCEAAQRYVDESVRLREALRIARAARVEVRELAAGEHNANFAFSHPETGARYVLRVGCASQMDFESPSAYEFEALRTLEPSGRTPAPRYLDDGPDALGRGVIVMDLLEGRALRYDDPNDMREAARVLADVHSVRIPATSGLLAPADPLRDQFEECRRMFARYRGSAFEDAVVVRFVERFFERAERALEAPLDPADCAHVQNTETTSDQFLMNGAGRRGYLIDWEKPIVGEVAQDVAYFLAPTSTIWQDGPILSDEERSAFVRDYWEAVDGRFARGRFDERFRAFSMTNNLRGVTWSCQAWVDYHDPARPLKHEATLRRLRRYLSEDFLGYLDTHVFS